MLIMGDLDPRVTAQHPPLAEQEAFVLGEATVTPALLTIELNGVTRELQPRIMRVLVALARARPELVSRERLLDECWDGRIVGDDALNRCILALRHLADDLSPRPFEIKTIPRLGYRLIEPPVNAGRTAEPQPVGRSRIGGRAVLVLAGALLLASTVWFSLEAWWPQSGTTQMNVVVASASSHADSRRLAEEVKLELGSLQQARPGARLLGEGDRSSAAADYLLNISAPGGPSKDARASLLSSGGREVLWSHVFPAEPNRASELKSRMAVTVANVLGCAIPRREAPARNKDYLNACAALADYHHDSAAISTALEQVVQESPRFVPAWASLLQAEMDALGPEQASDQRRARASLARHIVAARAIEPDLPEASTAEASLAHPTDYARRSRLHDTAVGRHPDHAGARIARANFLFAVGRVRDSLQDSQAAARLHPWSLRTRSNYSLNLAFAGRTDAAYEELADAERMWPGSTSLKEARFLLSMRYGNPREAQAMIANGSIELGGAVVHEPFLRARIDPTPRNIEQAIRQGRNVLRLYPEAISQHAQTLAHFDRRDELFRTLLGWQRMDHADYVTDVVFRPTFNKAHRDPRFLQVAKHFGLLDYWRTSGRWPDFCIAADLPYDCKAEAAKLLR